MPELACVARARERLRRQPRPLRLLLWETEDERMWQTAERLKGVAGVQVVVLGHPSAGSSTALAATHAAVTLDPAAVVHRWRSAKEEVGPGSRCELAAAALALGEVDVVVGGLATTSSEVLRAGLRLVGLAADVRTVSIGGFVEPVAGPAAGRLFLVTDTGAVPHPSLEQFADIAMNAVKSWRAIADEPPRVAFLSASTRGSAHQLPNLPAIHGAIARLKAFDSSLEVDGEMQADAAVSHAAKMSKGLDGPVAGQANILVFPDLDSCNIGYKLLEHLGGARTAPVTQGFARSFHDVSRGASVDDFTATCLLSCMIAAHSHHELNG